MNIQKIIALRRHLHQHPELSGYEKNTAAYLARFLQECNPYKLYTGVGGYGIIAHFKGTRSGVSCLFRCEMDALPIKEESGVPYTSVNTGVAHLCGHDGHAAILCGVALAAAEQSSTFLQCGDLFLLFQPAEEIGEGARKMQEDIQRMGLRFDYAFALHNLPGKEENTIVLNSGIYAYASVGMEIKWQGHTAHAAQPHLALNPTPVIAELSEIVKQYDTATSLCTIVHICIGEANYGVTPGNGEMHLTIRATQDNRLQQIQHEIERHVTAVSAKYGAFKTTITYHDPFPATVNDADANKIVEMCALKLKYKTEYAAHPQKGSDDFAFFTQQSKAAFFDIGCGENHPALHFPNYDFNENLLEPAIRFIGCVYQQTQLTAQAAV